MVSFSFSFHGLGVCVTYNFQADADNNQQKMPGDESPAFWDLTWQMHPIGTMLSIYQNGSKLLKIKPQLLEVKSITALMPFRAGWVLATGSSLMRQEKRMHNTLNIWQDISSIFK